MDLSGNIVIVIIVFKYYLYMENNDYVRLSRIIYRVNSLGGLREALVSHFGHYDIKYIMSMVKIYPTSYPCIIGVIDNVSSLGIIDLDIVPYFKLIDVQEGVTSENIKSGIERYVLYQGDTDGIGIGVTYRGKRNVQMVTYKMIFEDGFIYIGKTSGYLTKRIATHCRDAFVKQRNSDILVHIRKFKSFTVEVMGYYDSEEELDNAEIKLIEQYSRRHIPLLNSKGGGDCGKHSIETRKKMTKRFLNDECMGEEVDSLSKKLYMLQKNTKQALRCFANPMEAARHLGNSKKVVHIEKCCNGEMATAYGYRWEYR